MSGKSPWFMWFDDIRMKNLAAARGNCPLPSERDLITRPLESTMEPWDYWSMLQETTADQVLRYIAAESQKDRNGPLPPKPLRLKARRMSQAPWN